MITEQSTTRRHWPIFFIAFFAASTSGFALLLYASGRVPLSVSVTILAPLTAIIFMAIWVLSGGESEKVFLDRLKGGLIAGAVGLLAYDLIRLVILAAGVEFNPFRPIEIFGLLILNVSQDTTLTKSVGWAFHIWNGLSFAVMYTMIAGRGKVWWAVLWALLLETAMIVTYPSIFQVAVDAPFLIISLVGHLAYGVAVGLTARKVVRW
jgi:hypothetical protein